MKRRIIAAVLTLCMVVCLSVVGFAASSTVFYVNNVRITEDLSVTDRSDYNPLTGDSVTATANAEAVMDHMYVKAEVTYFTNGNKRTALGERDDNNCRSCSATATAPGFTVGASGTGCFEARHNGYTRSSTAEISW